MRHEKGGVIVCGFWSEESRHEDENMMTEEMNFLLIDVGRLMLPKLFWFVLPTVAVDTVAVWIDLLHMTTPSHRLARKALIDSRLAHLGHREG